MLQLVWAENEIDQKNRTFGFACDFCVKKGDAISVAVTASDIYKMYVDESLTGYGPARSAHGYTRIDRYEFEAKTEKILLTFEAVSYRINSYYLIDREPFFGCEIAVNGKVIKTAPDLDCYLLDDRVRKVQRYSFQRPFAEAYRVTHDRKDWYLRKVCAYEKRNTVPAGKDIIQIERGVALPELEEYADFLLTEKGSAEFDETRKLWCDRSIADIGDTLLGYRYDELEIKLSDDASRFAFTKNGTVGFPYVLFSAGKSVSGTVNLRVTVDKACRIYILFDEIASGQENGAIAVDCFRNECCNVIAYDLPAGGHTLSTFEIYTLKYFKVVCVGANMIEPIASVTEIKNPEGSNFRFSVSDSELQMILDAAVNTFEQNTLDILMDCPSRERAGWNNDCYFTADAEHIISGGDRVQRNSLENLLYADRFEHIPEGMLPMCYPCDHINGNYVPNCGIWVALLMCKHMRRYPDAKFAALAKKKIYGLIKYFDKFLNSDGLLEDLDGWVFIEWSKANDKDYVSGVNYPSNMMYYGLLRETAEVFGDDKLAQRAACVKNEILRQSYNGRYFEDNRVRENGKLVLKGHVTETCQYYAFYFGVADKDGFGELYFRLMRDYGFRSKHADPELAPSNIIIGIVLRQELLMRDGNTAAIIRECKDIFYPMAQATGTLWEHTESSASCNHGIASIVAKWLIFALTGYMGADRQGDPVFRDITPSVDCCFTVRCGGRDVNIEVKDGKVSV